MAVADHGGFGRAAIVLGMTQPALSRSVQIMEAEVGASLFERSKAGATPTDEARLLIQRARELLATADELNRELSLRRQTHGASQVTFGAGAYPAETVIPNALARFLQSHPRVRTRSLVRDWDELLVRLRAREIDFFVAETSTLEVEHDLHVDALGGHPMYFIGHPGHPLARRAKVGVEQVLLYPCLAQTRMPPRVLKPLLGALEDPAVRDAGRPFPALEFASLHATKMILRGSDAIAGLPLSCIAEELAGRSLVVLGREPWLTLRYGIVRLKGRTLGPAAQSLCEAIRGEDALLQRTNLRLADELRTPPARTRPGRASAH